MFLKYKVTFKRTCMPIHEHAIFVDHTCMAPAVSLVLRIFRLLINHRFNPNVNTHFHEIWLNLNMYVEISAT